MENIPDKIDSKFRYVLLAAERAEMIMQGAPSKVELPKRKPSRVAMAEVSRDLIDWDYGPPEEDELDEEAAAEAEAATE